MQVSNIICAIFIEALCVIMFVFFFNQGKDFNKTTLTHSLPNTIELLSFEGIHGVDHLKEMGLKKATDDLQDISARLDNQNTTCKFNNDKICAFIPPRFYAQIEKQSFNVHQTLHKFDSVPNIIRDIALPRISALVKNASSGTSIFLTNLEDRGYEGSHDNIMKLRYMKGLDSEHIQKYKDLTKPVLKKALDNLNSSDTSFHNSVLDAIINITFIIHSREYPEQDDIDFIKSGVEAFTSVNSVNEPSEALKNPEAIQRHILKHDYYMDRVYRKLRTNDYGGLFKSLKDNGYNEADIVVEYLHNILAMTIQWTILMQEIVELKQPNFEPLTSEQLYTHLKTNPTAKFVISNVDKDSEHDESHTHVIHSLKEVMKGHAPIDPTKNQSCPFAHLWKKTPEQAVVVKGTEIIEQDGNWGFGRGYRRCAGEVLTIEFMKMWVDVLRENKQGCSLSNRIPYGRFGFTKKYKTLLQCDQALLQQGILVVGISYNAFTEAKTNEVENAIKQAVSTILSINQDAIELTSVQQYVQGRRRLLEDSVIVTINVETTFKDKDSNKETMNAYEDDLLQKIKESMAEIQSLALQYLYDSTETYSDETRIQQTIELDGIEMDDVQNDVKRIVSQLAAVPLNKVSIEGNKVIIKISNARKDRLVKFMKAYLQSLIDRLKALHPQLNDIQAQVPEDIGLSDTTTVAPTTTAAPTTTPAPYVPDTTDFITQTSVEGLEAYNCDNQACYNNDEKEFKVLEDIAGEKLPDYLASLMCTITL